MANTPVEVKETAPAVANAPDTWRSFRTEMDRLFDRFAGGWGMPSLRRIFDAEPAFQYESSFAMPSPAVDISEDDGAYKVTAELPGMAEKEIEVVVSGDTLSIKGEKRLEKEQAAGEGAEGEELPPVRTFLRVVPAQLLRAGWCGSRQDRG